MAQNKKILKLCKAMYRQINQITPDLYAGIALALHRKYGWGYKRINDLFSESQQIWEECVQSDLDMNEICLNETGIDVRAKVTEKY